MRLLLVWFLVGLLEVSFTKGQQIRWRAGHSYPRPLPQEIMVDAVNYIGLILLRAHNQNNENNIALSPYGATSVLVALGEGVQGTALDEILRATLLPQDVSVTRVGLRDIHRHLKSYFIPQEGFLAGLTFSHENVTLKSSYENILRFYGYDVDSFNNALYPDPYSPTTMPSDESYTSNSVSNAANLSSSTAQSTLTSPSTLDIPSTIENRDEVSESITTTIETTMESTAPTTVTAIESTATNTAANTKPITTITATTSSSVDTSSLGSTVTTVLPSTTADITETPTSTTIFSTTAAPTTSRVTTTTSPVTRTNIPTTSRTTVVSTTAATTTPAPSSTITTSNKPSTSQTTVISSTSAVTTTQTTTKLPTTVTLPSTTQTTDTPQTTVQETTEITQTTSSHSTIDTTNLVTTTSVSTSTPSVTTTTPSPTTTSITIDVEPSTISNNNKATTTTTTNPTTQYQSTGPITVNFQPTAITNSNPTTISFSVNSIPNTITNGISTSSESTSVNLNPATQIGNTVSVPGTTLAITSVGSTTVNTDTTTMLTTSGDTVTPTVTNSVTDSVTTDTTNSVTSTIETSGITVNIVPSTVGSGTTGSTTESGTTQNSVSLLTVDGNLSSGFAIDVRPTTLSPKKADIVAESTNIRKNKNNKPTLPRFQDDVELASLLKSRNKLETVDKATDKSFISPSNFGGNKNTENTPKNGEELTTIKLANPENVTKEFQSSIFTSTADYFIEIEDDSSSTIKTDTSEIIDSKESEESKELLSESSSFEPNSDRTMTASEEAKTRTVRSVIDYLIARYHDSNPSRHDHAHGRSYSSPTEYEPAKPTTFSVNGKVREPNINFMTYDTVLPFRYISYLNALALTFPLDSTKYYLLLILPVDEMGIDNLVANMMSTTLKQIIYSLQPTRVKATIPSFTLKGYVVLTPTLQKLGIRQIFEPRHGDFSRMTEDKDIYVTNIEQAVTVTIRNYVDPSTVQNNQQFRGRGPVQFTADHPFLYFVMDSQIHVALMAGKIINPLNSRIR